MGFLGNVIGLLAKPAEAWARLEKQDSAHRLGLAFGHLALVTVAGALGLSLFFFGAILLLLPGGEGSAFAVSGALFLLFNLFGQLVFFGLAGAVFGGLWYHAWLTLFGVRDFRKTLTVYFYARTPALFQFLFAVPETGGAILYVLANLLTLYLFAHGIRTFHGLPLRSAASVLVIALAVNLAATVASVGGYRPAPLLYPQLSPASLLPLPVPPAATANLPAGPLVPVG
ncbi:MAG: YIP1 family protein [Halobacteria archaeon]